jgi:hypothetical protein
MCFGVAALAMFYYVVSQNARATIFSAGQTRRVTILSHCVQKVGFDSPP